MDNDDLPTFLLSLKAPLGLAENRQYLKGAERQLIWQYIGILQLRDWNGQVYFPEVLWSIFHVFCGVSSQSLLENKFVKEIFRQTKLKYPHLRSINNYSLDMLQGNILLTTRDGLTAH